MTVQLLRPVDAPLNQNNLFGTPDPAYTAIHLLGHNGLDLLCPVGTPVRCADDGAVAWAAEAGTAGNMVTVQHSHGQTRYLHLSRIGVVAGDSVVRGDVLGWSGGRPGDQGAGLSTGPHLHFDYKPLGADESNGYRGFVDPEPYLVMVAAPAAVWPFTGPEIDVATEALNWLWTSYKAQLEAAGFPHEARLAFDGIVNLKVALHLQDA